MTEDRRIERLVTQWLDEPVPLSSDRIVDAVLDGLPRAAQESPFRPVRVFGRVRLGALVAAALLLGLMIGASLVGRAGPSPTERPSTSVSPSPGASASVPVAVAASLRPGVIAAIDMKQSTWTLAVDERSVWVQLGDTIDRIDRATNTVTGVELHELRPLEVPAIAFGGDDLWALRSGTGIVRLHSITGEILDTLPGISGSYLAVDGRTAWVSDGGHSVDRVDLETGDIVATIDVPTGPKELVVSDGAVWVTCEAAGVVARIDIATNALVAEIPTGPEPVSVATGEGAVWVWRRGGALLRIDPATNEIVAEILSPAQPLIAPTVFVAGLAVGGGSVWVGSSDGINRVDPAVNEIVEILPVGPDDFFDLAWFDGELWATSIHRNFVYRIDPGP